MSDRWRIAAITIPVLSCFPPGGLGHVPCTVRRIVHVAVSRDLVTGSRRGNTILSDAAVAQARQY